MKLTIDPGVRTMGYVVWDNSKIAWNDSTPCPIVKADQCILERCDRRPWFRQVADLIEWLNRETREFELDEVVCEMPHLFTGARGDAAARQGDLTHMAYCVGSVAQLAKQQAAKFRPIEVREWKGQIPHNVVCDRVVKRIPIAYSKLSMRRGHDWDAAGIGLYCQGLF